MQQMGLSALYYDDQTKGLKPSLLKRLRQILPLLATAQVVEDMRIPGLRFGTRLKIVVRDLRDRLRFRNRVGMDARDEFFQPAPLPPLKGDVVGFYSVSALASRRVILP